MRAPPLPPEHVASFYLDAYSRPEDKRGGAWMGVCLGASQALERSPVAYLTCNGSPPVGDTPSLMTFREVRVSVTWIVFLREPLARSLSWSFQRSCTSRGSRERNEANWFSSRGAWMSSLMASSSVTRSQLARA